MSQFVNFNKRSVMELFGLLFAAPVALLASTAYVALVLALFMFLPVVGRLLVAASVLVVACVVVELVFLETMGAKATYARLGYGFTALHFFALALGPPALANLVCFFASRYTRNKWLLFFSASICCWVACMAALLANIAVDEAIVGIDSSKPFYMTPPGAAHKAAAGKVGSLLARQ